MVVTRLQGRHINSVYVQMSYAAFTSALLSAASTTSQDPKLVANPTDQCVQSLIKTTQLASRNLLTVIPKAPTESLHERLRI